MRAKAKKVAAAAAPVPAPAKPLEISIKPRELDLQFHSVLDDLTQLVVELPTGVLLPTLGGDFGADVPGAEP
jgi:hypothetical protein